MKIHVGFVLSSAPGYSEVFLTNTMKTMLAKGIKVTLFTDKPGKVIFVKHVAGFRLPRNRFLRPVKVLLVLCLTFLRAPLRVLRYVSVLRSDNRRLPEIIKSIFISSHILPCRLTHIHFGFATLGIYREHLGRVMDAKLSTSIRGYDVCIYPLVHKNAYELLWKNLDRLHTISSDLYNVACRLGLPLHVPHVKINPAVDVNLFPSLDGKAKIGSQWPLRIITVARLHWKKGIDYALEALLLLKNKGIDFTYTVIGTGEERERLIFLVHQMGLTECVEFAGKLPHDQVINRMGASHLYLQPSIQEGFCNAVLEAQASGLLCIVSDAEGLQENILHGQTGWVVPKRNPDVLARKILEVIALPEEQKQVIRRSARRRVEEEFSLELQAKRFAEFFS
ncbi:MAG: glycosyltransferase family 4 protein [Cyclobacteriaceae bacterium]|nr:glycosyltransferase family 4 protein [Cyclobacteriaceae bacterium]